MLEKIRTKKTIAFITATLFIASSLIVATPANAASGNLWSSAPIYERYTGTTYQHKIINSGNIDEDIAAPKSTRSMKSKTVKINGKKYKIKAYVVQDKRRKITEGTVETHGNYCKISENVIFMQETPSIVAKIPKIKGYTQKKLSDKSNTSNKKKKINKTQTSKGGSNSYSTQNYDKMDFTKIKSIKINKKNNNIYLSITYQGYKETGIRTIDTTSDKTITATKGKRRTATYTTNMVYDKL